MDIRRFKDCSILVIGDLMIDAYLWGEVERISPEAPVQVVEVKSEDTTLGGAGNVINNLVALGAKVSAVGIVGADPDGVLLCEKLRASGVGIDGVVQEAQRCTTRKTRIIAAHQHVLRLDRETRREISAENRGAMLRAVTERLPACDVVMVSDYGKGVVTKALVSETTRMAKSLGKTSIADPKGLDFKKYAGITVLTPNKKEASAAAGMEIHTESDLVAAGNRILHTVEIDSLLVTCGKEGMVVFERNESPYVIHAEARQVFDVSGAGDTVAAVLGLALAAGAPLKQAASLANTAAGIVVGKVGTATVSPAELSAALESRQDPVRRKERQVSELAALSRELKRQGQRVVFTNGCFDLLHAGHIRLFAASKQLGDVLVVAIDDDAAVAALKGPGRPVLKATERVRMLSALDSIDYVVVFASGQLDFLIQTLQPAVLTKGSNYTSQRVYGHEQVEKIGGRVVLIPVVDDISSSRIIDGIKNNRPS